jgi:hypothetical protein
MADPYRATMWSLENLEAGLSIHGLTPLRGPRAGDERSEKMYKMFNGRLGVPARSGWSFFLAAATAVILLFANENAWCQQRIQPGHVAPKATAIVAPPQEKPTATAPLDPSSALGQALAACDKRAESGSFALPGLKADVTLDRCYKGRDHMTCVFDAVISEAKSLMDSYTKIVDVKYPEINSVENICKLKRDALASDINGADDFIKRFAVLKSEYEAGTKCAASVKQGLKDVVLTDMAQPPEILKSMDESMEADINRVSQTENQAVDLAAKMQVASKAMQTIEKIHRAMCLKEKTETSELKENIDATGATSGSNESKEKPAATAIAPKH